jgi:hypothetical protein
MTRGIGLLALGLWAGLAPAAYAQAEALAPGRDVHLYVRGVIAPFEGTLTAVEPDGLTLTLLDGSVFTISPEQLHRSEVLGARRNLRRGGLIGGALGLAVGVGMVVGSRNDCPGQTLGYCDTFGSSFRAWHLIVPPLAGAASGALVGHFIRTPRWVPGVLPQPSANGEVGLAIAWSAPLGLRL